MILLFAGEGWGEGMSRMVIDDEMWSRLEKLLPNEPLRGSLSALLNKTCSLINALTNIIQALPAAVTPTDNLFVDTL